VPQSNTLFSVQKHTFLFFSTKQKEKQISVCLFVYFLCSHEIAKIANFNDKENLKAVSASLFLMKVSDLIQQLTIRSVLEVNYKLFFIKCIKRQSRDEKIDNCGDLATERK
jgi:hypothetical protein